jgi:hypothetical protein
MADQSDEDLLKELGVELEIVKQRTHTPREERIIAGFEDIERFYEEHGRIPIHGEDRDIFERLYAVRLDRLREQESSIELLSPLDKHGLLQGHTGPMGVGGTELDDEELLAELGIEPTSDEDIRVLKHVRTAEERKAAEDLAKRQRCLDFEKFEPVFKQVQEDIASGVRQTRPFELKAEIQLGRLFIVGGQIAYIAEMGDIFITDHGRTDARLRVVFDNGTESNMLMRSLQRALNADDAGRRITDASAGPLFGNLRQEGDSETGTIYVLRSKSDHPEICKNREFIHKIGVTSADVKQRIAGARLQTTFLRADVEVVATYQLYNINRAKLEGVIHKIFANSQIDITIDDSRGNPTKPREWFMVPLSVIKEAIDRILDGTILEYVYDPSEAALRLPK